MKTLKVIVKGLLLSANFIACNTPSDVPVERTDSVVYDKSTPSESKETDTVQLPKMYSNERFKDVTVENLADDKYRVMGKAQVFEAALSWVVEDGHNELKQGYEMTNAGAPEWGEFDFTFQVKKVRDNSTLTLILFESSAKDGSRQHELPIPL
jgi:hypothetical protein